MLFSKPHNIVRGSIVKLSNEDQEMEVTYVYKHWFTHDTISVIWIKPDGSIEAPGGFHPDSLQLVR